MKHKNLSLIFSYLSDVTLVAWIYFEATNYQNYAKTIEKSFDSPDFQVQLFHVLMQSLTFALLLFLAAQTVVYILAWRNFKSAYFYLKFFAIFGFALSAFITVRASFFAILPLGIYLWSYYNFSKTA